WLFNGNPAGADQPLHVPVARLLGYQWPRQTGSSFPDCPALGPDGLEKLADADGIVCLPSVRGERPAHERLLHLLEAAWGDGWSNDTLSKLLAEAGSNSLDDWLCNQFFEQHCKLFHQRPFIWHIWDGRKRDGFHALINYHKLAEGDGRGRRLLESLTYSYLGEWIARQQNGVKRGEGGADDRLAAALELQKRLVAILEGEPPFDLFVRWKPIEQQAIGWEPDINDGVRLNIRPFMAQDIPGGKKSAGIFRTKPNIHWRTDRGKEPMRDQAQFPWFWKNDKFTGARVNDVHLTVAQKRAARERAGDKQP
ncbi:MAG TPA: SAM-dependent methyltransferase, partial [Methyloceanibacter sp.]|nr:SAM-dependent methyltransferase [Methyloceanibacter sp.]